MIIRRKLYVLLKRLCRDTRGVSAVEYVVLAAGVAVVIVIAMTFTGTQITNSFSNTSAGLTGTFGSSASNPSGGQGSSNSDDDDSSVL